MSTRPLLNALRIAFLLGSLCAVFTALQWKRVRPYTVKLDKYLVERLTKEPTETFDAAIAQLKAGEEEAGLSALTKLAGDLRDVRLGTRLATVKTDTLDELGARLLAAGKHEEAMQWTEELLDYDPRDFPALIRRAELHRLTGNDESELEDIQAAFRVGAAPGPAIGPFIDAMARRGRRDEIAEALLGLGHSGPLVVPPTGWEFRWAEASEADYAGAVDFSPKPDPLTGRLRGETPTQPGVTITVQHLRVDLPQGLHAALQSLEVDLTIQDGSKRSIGLAEVVRTSHLEPQEGGGFVAQGLADPYLVMEVPGSSAWEGVAQVSITMDIHPLLPPAAAELFQEGISAEEREAWGQQFGVNMVSALEVGLGR